MLIWKSDCVKWDLTGVKLQQFFFNLVTGACPFKVQAWCVSSSQHYIMLASEKLWGCAAFSSFPFLRERAVKGKRFTISLFNELVGGGGVRVSSEPCALFSVSIQLSLSQNNIWGLIPSLNLDMTRCVSNFFFNMAKDQLSFGCSSTLQVSCTHGLPAS